MSSGPGMKEKSALRRNPKPSGRTSRTPSALMGVSLFCACRMWKISSCLRSAPGASMFSSFASLARARIFISFSSDRFIWSGALLARFGGARAGGTGLEAEGNVAAPCPSVNALFCAGHGKHSPSRRGAAFEASRSKHRYYVLDAPTLSDAEYDRLFRELEQIE